MRMFGDRTGGGGVSVSGGGDSGVSMSWVDGNFVSKEFFNQLFTVHGTRTYIDEETEEEVTEEVVITPNQIIDGQEYKLSDVQVSVGLWTKQFLSALGLNPAGGGGGGGATTLGELSDVTLTDLQPGQVLAYSNGMWRNVNNSPGGVTSVAMSVPKGFTINGSPITSAGTLNLGFASGYTLPPTSKQNQWDAAYTWYQSNPLNGYATEEWIEEQGYITQSDLQGYATESWVDNRYVSKAYFARLFKAFNGTTEVTPNSASGTIDNIKAMVGLWTEQYLSALGQNSAGGGGGGASTLGELSDVTLTDLQAGQILEYSNGMWRNVNNSPDGVVSVGLSVPTGFSVSGSPVTSSGTLRITFDSGYSLPTNAKQREWDGKQDAIADLATIRSNAAHGQTAYGWGNHAIQGYATQTWVNNQDYVKQGSSPGLRSIEFSAVPSTASDGGYIDFHYQGNEGDYTSRIIESAQGRLALNNTAFFYLENVTGSDIFSPVTAYSSKNFRVRMTNTVLMDSLCLSGTLVMRNAQGISMMDTSNTEHVALRVDTGNNLILGENFQSYNTYVRGNVLFLQTGSSNTEAVRIDANGNVRQYRNNTSYVMRSSSGGDVTMMRLNSSNVLEYGYGSVTPNYQTNLYGGSTKGIGFYCGATEVASVYRYVDSNQNVYQGIRIGNALLSWDSANNALKLSRPDGTAANFYALGGVSALGLSGTGGASVTQVNVTEALNFNNDTKLMFRNAAGSLMSAMTVDDSNNLIVGEAWSPSGYNTYMRGNYFFIQTGASYTTRMTINPNGFTTFSGSVQASRFYLDSSRYLHVSSGHLYFYNGTTDSLII